MVVRVRVPLAAHTTSPMKHTLPLFFFVMLLTACGVDSGHYKLSGRFLNMNQGEFYIYCPEGGIEGIDTIKVEGGRFTYEKPCERKAILMLVFPNFSEQPIFAAPGKSVEMKADASHMKEMEVKGTKDNELMTAFRRQTMDLAPPEVAQQAGDFIKNHPESPVGTYLLRKYFIQAPSPDYNKAVTLIAYMLQKQPKSGALQLLQRQLNQLKYSMKDAIPHFSGPTIDGGTASERDLGENVGVVCTWSTWSYESQEMMRLLKRKARSSGGKLKVVGICVDADKKAAQKIMERDSITCPVIFDGQLLETTAMLKAGLSGVPDNLIVDHHRVVASGLSRNDMVDKIDQLTGNSKK